MNRTATRIGGWALIVAAFAFTGVFIWLAARFDYPQVLDGTADQVLPRLLSLGTTGRAVWSLYGLLPLLLIPAGVGAHAMLREHAPGAARTALVTASLSALVMLMGLMRWPSIRSRGLPRMPRSPRWTTAFFRCGCSPSGL